MDTSSIFDTASTKLAEIAGQAPQLITDNLVVLLAVPVAFVVWRLAKRALNKVG